MSRYARDPVSGSILPVAGGGSGGHTILDEDGTTYPQRSKLRFEGCEVTDDAVNGVTVVKCEGGAKKYAKPTITVGTYTYDGTTQAPTITGFDANVMTLTGTYEAINAGSYTFTIALKDKTSSKWTDDTQGDIVTNWSIDAISVAVPTVTNTTKTYNGSAQSPTITRDTNNTTVSGTTSATKVKSNYSFSIALTDTTNHKWSDNTTAAKSYTWKINPPTGSSYTPVNNIQAWLQCASIDKTYTTIAQVLADATTLSALMLSNNAVDYLVRSTSWVSNITGNQTAMTDIGMDDYCSETLWNDSTWQAAIVDSDYIDSVLTGKIPTMSDYSNSVGSVSATSEQIRSEFAYSNRAWQALDGHAVNGTGTGTGSVISGTHHWQSDNTSPASITFAFSSAKPIKMVRFLIMSNKSGNTLYLYAKNYSVDVSKDNLTWINIAKASNLPRETRPFDNIIIPDNKLDNYRYVRITLTGSYNDNWLALDLFQIYWRDFS